jgi:hypothetical protein
MKISAWMEHNLSQIVLTPENETEKSLLNIVNQNRVIKMYHGSFYQCQGGWVRQGSEPDSIILVLEPELKSSLGDK